MRNFRNLKRRRTLKAKRRISGEALEPRWAPALLLPGNAIEGEFKPAPTIGEHNFDITLATQVVGTLNADASVLVLGEGETSGTVTLDAKVIGPHSLPPHPINFEIVAYRNGVVADSVDVSTADGSEIEFSLDIGGLGVTTVGDPHEITYTVTVKGHAGFEDVDFQIKSFNDDAAVASTTNYVGTLDVRDRDSLDTTSPTLTASINEDNSGPGLNPTLLNPNQLEVFVTVSDPAVDPTLDNEVTVTYDLTGPNGPIAISPETFSAGTGAAVSGSRTIQQAVSDAGQYSLSVVATDKAGLSSAPQTFTFAVVGEVEAPTPAASGTPVFNEIFDLQPFLNSPENTLGQIWQMSLDKTTQTVWFNAEFGDKTGQFDPATGKIRVFDTSVVTPDSNPHGVFFDLETHLTPKVWIAHRNAHGSNAAEGGEGDFGIISYLDVRENQSGTHNLVSYSFENISAGTPDDSFFHLHDFHAVFVDAAGDVWAAAAHDNRIIKFDMPTTLPDNITTDSLGNIIEADQAKLRPEAIRVFDIPNDVTGGFSFQPHGLEVIVDERTGEQYVWMISEGGSGHIVLLRPEAGPEGNDLWITWTGMPSEVDEHRGTFVKIDDNETPGIPDDDKVIGTFPVARTKTANPGNQGGSPATTAGLAFILDPGDLGAGAAESSEQATAITVQIPKHPTSSTGSASAINQPFVSREGIVYFVDRLGSVGRIDPDGDFASAPFVSRDNLTTWVFPEPGQNSYDATSIEIDPSDLIVKLHRVSPETETTVPRHIPLAEGPTTDFSTVDGVDQYLLMGPSAAISGRDKGQGAFRGATNASNVLYGSLSQNDMISSTIFAETDRRQLATVQSPVAGIGREGRMVFQVQRDGGITLTARGNGQVEDRQQNLTLLANANPSDAEKIDGDVSAVALDNGQVVVFGRNFNNDVVVYRYTPNMLSDWNVTARLFNNWSVSIIPAGTDANTGILVGNPIAYQQANGQVFALVTTSNGHLLRYADVGGVPTDLSVGAAADEVMYADVAVVVDGAANYFYGTNQLGDMVQYREVSGAVRHEKLAVPADRDLMVFQSVNAVAEPDAAGVHHVFATDGHTQLVHFEVQEIAGGPSVQAENVTATVIGNGNVFGYFDFQKEFGGRVYSDLSVLHRNDTLFVYGTNGNELILFLKQPGGEWRVSNLTNDVYSVLGDIGDPARGGIGRTPANRVFGSPSGYITDQGARRILQINAQGELVEYSVEPRFAVPQVVVNTQNLNLISGQSPTELSLSGESTEIIATEFVAGDFNGDGKSDMAAGIDGRWVVALAHNTDSEFDQMAWGDSFALSGLADFQVADVNGDGNDDLIGRARDGTWHAAISDGTKFVNQTWGSWSANVDWVDVLVGDFDGDGHRDDVAGRENGGSWWIGRSNGTRFVNERWDRWNPAQRWQNVLTGDFNGDQRDDLAGRATNGTWWVAQSDGTSFASRNWGQWSTQVAWQDIVVGDLNNDQRDDILGRVPTGRWWAGVSTGTRFSTVSYTVWSSRIAWQDVSLIDINADGRADLIGRTPTGSWWGTLGSAGPRQNQKFAQDVMAPNTSVGRSSLESIAALAFGDFDGDDRDELVRSIDNQWSLADLADGAIAANEDWGSLSDILTPAELGLIR